MQTYYLFIYLFLKSILHVDGQQHNLFFRNDYKYMEATKSFYKIHTLYRTWEKAKIKCSLEGAKLFYAEDENEANMVLDHMNNTQPTIGWVYIGISSLLAKGVFMTVDGVAVRDIYNVWGPGEPNDNNGEENCVTLRTDGTLNDVKCSNRFPFICKKTLQALKWNEECNTPHLGKCYKFHLHPLTWRDAVGACDAEQAHLAIANSQQEAALFVNITANAPKDSVQGSHLRGAVHLGFSYDQIQKDWKTFTGESLEQAGYAAWGGNQPDGGDNEKCGSMFYDGSLNDINCDAHRCFFICEKENRSPNMIDDKINEV